MPSQGYERVGTSDAEDMPVTPFTATGIPNSPPPSFHSRSSSPLSTHRRSTSTTQHAIVDRMLAETFEAVDGDSDSDDDDDRQRLVRSTHSATTGTATTASSPPMGHGLQRRGTDLPAFVPSPAPNTSTFPPSSGRSFMPSNNDGVFANLNAKPQAGDNVEEQPPSYEQAAADATPPYWETTLLAPGMLSDEVYIDGLPVGSFFSFAWNGIIAMAFPLVGFLLTYLLHTTHAARNGSRAGLGVTLVNYGFTMRSAGNDAAGGDAGGDGMARPADPDRHDFEPGKDPIYAGGGAGGEATDAPDGSGHSGDWLAYLLMIAGWIILIKAVTDYIRARRHEQLVLQSPERNLPPPVTADTDSDHV